MGGSSTSQGAVLGSNIENGVVYDLKSWQGLTEVLRVGKECLTKPGEYAEFRNLVLGYAQRGGDEAMRQHIDTIIGTFAERKKQQVIESIPVTVEVEDVELEKEKPTHSFALGGRRMQPRFVAGARFVKSEDPVKPTADVPAVPNVPARTHSDSPVEIVTEEAKEKVEEKQTIPVHVEKKPILRTLEEHKARITEIKRLVHERVGNPAALVGSHSTVGKTYMVALLSALKATGAGESEGVEEKMSSLEEAYEQLVSDAIPRDVSKSEREVPAASHSSGAVEVVKQEEEGVKQVTVATQASHEVAVEQKEKDLVEKTPEAVPTQTEEKNDFVKDKVVGVTPFASPSRKVDVSSSVERQKVPSEVPNNVSTQTESNTSKNFTDSDQVIVGVLKAETEKQKSGGFFASLRGGLQKKDSGPTLNQKASKKLSEKKPVFEESHFAKEENGTGYAANEADDEQVETQTTDVDAFGITKHAVRKLGAQPLESVEDEIGVHPTEVAMRQSELFTPEISEALDTLLHEWSIFSSSGIFGTGPGGPEHPLYQKLSPLSMGEVVAGRWEGSTSKIQKTIKEYVDAWRHEQGIAYTINETFEHYLRRVVQKILKRQKQGMGAY